MCGSIREFGFKIPVRARSNGEVVDGHLRLKAARKLNIAEVPVILCDEWTEAQVKAVRLLVNRSVTWATWDEDLLALRTTGAERGPHEDAMATVTIAAAIGWALSILVLFPVQPVTTGARR